MAGTTDGPCCAFCNRPAQYTFKNMETGFQGEMCKHHRDALDIDDPKKFRELGGESRIMDETTGAFSRHNLRGHRIDRPNPGDRGGPGGGGGGDDGWSLVSDRERQKMQRVQEQMDWNREVGRDPWGWG